ncbi:glycosyltransferase family 4 protein [Halobacillus sp. A5]|uniref:glycosyltransferase family 4 protein n=1 Tax=Halobacillus sp. A5 TaxID=2880263 RepID=UPI0020A62261|nr:MraY family glycosyltransferase [Halobacillus sp. A5]MCP3028084.1 undecaprenyl/decaprenyl-phosphate alpha-N-acetylglucosaminyl 1-phosphate transferase [Halobacillus sp. A5]
MELQAFLFCFIIAVCMTPFIIKLSKYVGAVDHPDIRKVHTKKMPRLGGAAIFFSVVLGFLFFIPNHSYAVPLLIGGVIIAATGIFDDILNLPPLYKLFGQSMAAAVVISSGVKIEFVNLPFGAPVEFGFLSIPITLFWIIGITNAINLVDGLDGLAAGISSIALLTITSMAVMMGNQFVVIVGLLVLGATLGFLVYNFYPAKIFMGDTGAMFLGFMISVLALLGFKNVTLFSFVIPILILGVPISDTLITVIRRKLQNQPIMKPDFAHLHHNLLKLGCSHPQTVIIIYTLSALFSLAAVLFSQATLINSLVVVSILIFSAEIIIEISQVAGEKYRPLLNKAGLSRSKE